MELEAIERCEHGMIEGHWVRLPSEPCPGGRRIPVTPIEIQWCRVHSHPSCTAHDDANCVWVAAALVDPDGKPLETP
jgi:hypothetical protein